jgi:hypothetical protein
MGIINDMENLFSRVGHNKLGKLVEGDENSMKFLLKNIAFALLFVILLMGLASGKAEAQPRIEITPQQFAISGIIGTSPFQYPFTVRAVNENITELTFSPSNLMEISRGKTWIIGANVQITPAVSRIKKGQSQDFIVTVQNIPESGQYEGTIAVSYKEQAADAQDTLSISVQAAKFSASPPQIILRFEKSLGGLGGTSGIPWTLALNEESGRAPQEMMVTLAANASVSLDSLVHSEDKSQVIRPEQILVQPVAIETRAAGQGLTINTTFTNPQVTAGKYTGTLTVRSESLGLLASVPVEVQVRYPSWLAWLLLVAGVIASMLISWWNTTGKKKNAILGDAFRLREKLQKADITEECSSQIEEQLNEVQTLLLSDNLEKAQEMITTATKNLETCRSNKKELKKKADEVEGLIERWDQVEEQVNTFVASDAAVVKTYLPGVKKALRTLKGDIKEGHRSVDEALNSVAIEKKKLDAFGGLLDGLVELEGDLKLLDQAYRGALEQRFIQPIKVHFRAIVRDKDIEDVAGEIKNAGSQFKRADELRAKLMSLDQQIKDLKQQGLDMHEAEKALKACEGYLAHANIDMAENHLDDIEKAIDAAPRPIVKAVASHDVLRDFDFALGLKNRQERSTMMVSTLSTVLEAGSRSLRGLTDDEENILRAMRNLQNTRVEISHPEALLGEYVGASGAVPRGVTPSRPGVLDPLRQWLTPVRQEMTIKIMLYLILIPLLAVIGFSQLYANNFTFGAKNVWEEYLALLLWGFGIQMSTATVASVVKTFRGS